MYTTESSSSPRPCGLRIRGTGCCCYYYYYYCYYQVGDKKSFDYENAPKFPHIYGGIRSVAVIKTFKIVRDENGSFLSIPGLC